MVTITAPGIQMSEVDLSFYDFPQPKEETLNVLVAGFATQGHNNYPYEFTNKNTDDDLIATFGTPTTEAERYFFNTCSEAIKREKTVLYATRLPYSNTATNNYKCAEYAFNKAAIVLSALDLINVDYRNRVDGDYGDLLPLKNIVDADSTLSDQFLLEVNKVELKSCSESELNDYRTSSKKPAQNHFIIVEKNQEIYEKIPADAKHMQLSSRYMLGVLPIVTTATNAMYYLKLIADSLISTEMTYDKNTSDVSAREVIDIYAVNGYKKLSTDLDGNPISGELSGYDPTCFYSIKKEIEPGLSCCITDNPTDKMFAISVYIKNDISAEEYIKDADTDLSSVAIRVKNGDDILSAFQYGKRMPSTLSCFEPTDSISSETVALEPDLMVYPPSSKNLDANNKDALTLSKYAMGFFPPINFLPDGSFDRDRLRNIGVVVFKGWVDPEAGNKVKYEPVEAFAGSLKSDDVDPVTGVSRFIDDIINTNSNTIEFYSNCFNAKTIAAALTISDYDKANNPKDMSKTGRPSIDILFKTAKRGKASLSADSSEIEALPFGAYKPSESNPNLGTIGYEDLGLLHINQQPSYTLGFKEIDAKSKAISYNLIMSSLDKIYEKNKDINEKQIDLVVDAGVANIAQFMSTVNGNADINSDSKSVWLSGYDPLAYQDDDENTKTQNETRSAVALWDICTRMGDGSASVKLEHATDQWELVLKKYTQFCSKMRGDCMFLADGLRPFCIKGQQKRVSKTNFNSTVSKSLTPFIKWMSGKIDTSYGAGYCDWYQITDPTSEVNMWMPPSTKAMCIMLDNFNRKFYWTAPAGVNNGRLNPIDNPSKVVVKDIAFSPTVEEAGNIYTKCWNYATYYKDEGFVMEGLRTFQSRATAFDRINVRRVFLYLERKVAQVGKYFLYEGNTSYARQRFLDTITPFFEDCKIKGGIADYKLQCDEKNNPPEVIDRNELHVKVAIKPTKAIEFIEITFVCLRTGASWSEAGM